MSEELSEIELKDIEKALEEKRLGKTRKFSNARDALAWLHSSEGEGEKK